MTPLQWLAAAWLVGVGGLLVWRVVGRIMELDEWEWREMGGMLVELLKYMAGLVVLGLTILALLTVLFPDPAHARPVFVKLTHAAIGDTGLAHYNGELRAYTIRASDSTYQLIHEPVSFRVGRGVVHLGWTQSKRSASRPVFVRKADGRTTIMVERSGADAERAEVARRTGGLIPPTGATSTGVVLSYTIPQWQSATVGCDAPAMNPIAAHVDSIRLIAWLPMPDDSRVWNLAAWVAAQQAGRPSPIVVRTKWIGGRTGVDTIGVPAGLPVGTTGAVVSFAGDSVSCVSNLARLVNP